MIRFSSLLLLWLLGSMVSAQLTLMVGDEAHRITPNEYLMNGLKKSDLKDKFLVLTLCKSWDQPCFNDLSFQDSLRSAYPNDKVEFLTLFRGSTELALNDTKGKSIGIPLATDLYGKTQIRYGDGETGLVGWPLTILIDDQNIVRWQGDGDDLTIAALDRFVNGQYPVSQLSEKYVPLDPDDFLFEPMTIKNLSALYDQDSVGSFVRIWDESAGIDSRGTQIFSSSLNFGHLEFITLEEIYQKLFPKKKVSVPDFLMEKRYIVSFIERFPDRESIERLESGILADLGLSASSKNLQGTYFSLEVLNKEKLEKSRKLPEMDAPLSKMANLGSVDNRDLHEVKVKEYSLAGLAKILNEYSQDRWQYSGNNRKKYNFILDVSSTKALLKSLRKQGIGANGEAGTVEEVTLERKR